MKHLKTICGVILITSFILTSCGGNSLEKDATKIAEMTCNFITLQNKDITGHESELIKLGTELQEFKKELDKKYASAEDKAKFQLVFNKALLDCAGYTNAGNINQQFVDTVASQKPSGELMDILINYDFMKTNGFMSFIALSFTSDNKYKMLVYAVGQGEVVNVRGTYQAISNGNSEAEITLFPGPIQKSAAYNAFEDFDIEVFVGTNIQYTLRKFSDSDVEKFAKENPMMAQSYIDNHKLPIYVLDGSVVFYADKPITEAEKDSIANIEQNKKEKAAALEEKLKGL